MLHSAGPANPLPAILRAKQQQQVSPSSGGGGGAGADLQLPTVFDSNFAGA